MATLERPLCPSGGSSSVIPSPSWSRMRAARRACPWTSSPSEPASTDLIGLLERRSRQPTLAVAANLAEALGLSLAELVGKAEEDVGNGVVSDIEIPSAPRRRHAERAHLGEGSRLAGVAQLTSGTIAQAIDFAYRKLDLIDEQMRGSGSPPLAKLVDLPSRRSWPTCSAQASRGPREGSYLQNGSEHGPSLTPLRQGLPELEVAAALKPTGPRAAHPQRAST